MCEIRRSADADSEIIDERCYFPLANIDMTLPERYKDNMPHLKRVYSVVDKASYLDWGLTSDFDVGADGDHDGVGEGSKRRAARATADRASMSSQPLMTSSTQYSSSLASFAHKAARRSIDSRKTPGMSSGSAGSEGYGEATTGSVHKLGLLLRHLRSLVLEDLYDTHWGLMWDLGAHSTFLDIGSGYGKVVLHLRLMARMRTSVGMEVVASRDAIAKQALSVLEVEISGQTGVAALPAAPRLSDGEVSSSDGDSASTLQNGTDDMPHVVRGGPFAGVEFQHGDATTYEALTYTHIYIFDWVFSQNTLHDLAPVLQASPFYILCSFRKVTEWWSHGLVKIQPVAKLSFHTTGGEGMTCFVYVNLEKVPAQ